MLIALIFMALKCILCLFLTMFILIVVAVVAFKMWYEPFKGVCKSDTRLDGKVVIVTGGNSGIGLETARDLASRGARVIIACRNAERSKEAIEDITKTTGNTNLEYIHLDLSKFASVRKFAEDINNNEDRLDILVNNAGLAGVKKRITDDGVDLVQQINYLGAFLLTNLLVKKLIQSKPSRIVLVSSVMHYLGSFDVDDLACLKTKWIFKRYAISKLCQVLWAKALARRLPSGVTINVLHPGGVKTNIWDNITPSFKKIVHFVLDLLFKSPKEGAQTSIYLSVASEVENVSGEYFSDCKLRSSSKLSNDYGLAEKVWQKSLELTNMECLSF